MWFFKGPPTSKPTAAPIPLPAAPAITAATIAEAKRRPGGWVYAMDGISDQDGAVPPERILGAWKVNDAGDIVGDFLPNPNHRPVGRDM
jgi:hypothetical protein